MTLQRTIMALCVSSLMVFAAGIASAEEERLSTQDYNMNDLADLHRLQTKIVQIARRMCVGLHKEWSYFYSDDVKLCIEQTTDNAIESTGHAGLQTVHTSVAAADRYDPDRDISLAVDVAGK